MSCQAFGACPVKLSEQQSTPSADHFSVTTLAVEDWRAVASMLQPPQIANKHFAALADWFSSHPAYSNCQDPMFEWPVPRSLVRRVPVSQPGRPIIVGAQLVTDPLFMSTVPPGKVLAEAALLVKQVGLSPLKVFARCCLNASSEADQVIAAPADVDATRVQHRASRREVQGEQQRVQGNAAAYEVRRTRYGRGTAR